MKYEVKGRIQLGRMNQVFTKEVEAENEERAKTLVFSDFGGKYRINRRKIKIEEVTQKKGTGALSKAPEKEGVAETRGEEAQTKEAEAVKAKDPETPVKAESKPPVKGEE